MNHRLVLGGIFFVFVATLVFLAKQDARIKPYVPPEPDIIYYAEQLSYFDPCEKMHTTTAWMRSYKRGTPKPTPYPIPTKCINGVPTP